MPNIKAAVKALRQTKKRTARNRRVKNEVEMALRITRKALVAKSTEASKLVAQTIKTLDKSAQKGVLKKNTVARLKSRLMKSLHKIKK